MSVFFPYNPSVVLDYFANLFNLDFSQFTPFESLLSTILANLYFLLYWGLLIYFSLKIFNRIWERIF